VAGAIGLHVRTGELVVCKAKAVVLTLADRRLTVPGTGYLYQDLRLPGETAVTVSPWPIAQGPR
jgi:hypothetical protein